MGDRTTARVDDGELADERRVEQLFDHLWEHAHDDYDNRIVRARVAEKREVAKGTLLVLFDLEGEDLDFRPGQYFWVELLDPPYQDERGARRHISVVNSPTERGILGLATRIRDTAFKRSLEELQVGDEVEVEPPKGDFRLPDADAGPFVFIAGGIGITVFRSMLRYIRDERLPHRVTLFYSNRDHESAAFLDELSELERELPGFRLVATMTGEPDWAGETRRIDVELLRDQLEGDLGAYTYLIAGPPPMVEGIVETLAAAGVPDERVVPDRFSGY